MDILYESSFQDDFFVSLIKKSKDEIYGIQHITRRMYILDFKSNCETFFKDISFENNGQFKLFQTAVCFNEICYFLPFFSDNLVVMREGELKYIYIHEMTGDCKNGKFMNAIIYGDYMIIIPYSADVILWYDLKNELIFKNVCIREVKNEEDLFYSVAVVDDILYIPSMTKDKIIIYNLKTDELSSFSTEVENEGYNYILEDENKLYLVAKSRPLILEYDLNNKSIIRYDDFPCKINSYGKTLFDPKCTFLVGRSLYCIPGTANVAVIFNLDSKKIIHIEGLDKFCQNEQLDKNRFVFDGGINDNGKLFLQFQNNTFVELNTDTLEICEHFMKLEKNCDGLQYFVKHYIYENNK